MLICYDCENELKDEYLEKIKKENRMEYIIERQHSKIKRKLLDDDNNSKFGKDSYYTDNNDYIPNNNKFNRNKNSFGSKFDKIRKNVNLEQEIDKFSINSYNGIITDYSKRRRKNKIKDEKKRIEDIPNDYMDNQKVIQNNIDKNSRRKYDDIYYNEINNKRNTNKKNHEYNKIDEDYDMVNNNDEIFSEKEKNDIYSNEEKEFISNKDDQFNNEIENEDDEDNNWNLNSNSFKDINKNIKLTMNHNQNNNNKLDYHHQEEEDNNFYQQNKNSIEVSINKKKSEENKEENKNYSPFEPFRKNKSIQKENKLEEENKFGNNFIKFNSEKDFNENNKDFRKDNSVRKSEESDIYNSIYYERVENEYIQKNKNKHKDKNIINKEDEEKEKFEKKEDIFSSQSLNPNSNPEISQEENENMKNVVFNNRYIHNYYRNDVTERYNDDNNEMNNKKVLYQDFYYKEVSYSPNSSERSSVISQSNYSENNNLRTSYPEDGKRNRIKRNKNKIIEPENEFDKYIFEQINKIRENPRSFVDKIESAKKNIDVDKRNNYIYNGKQKILLNNGIYAFDNAIKHLNVLQNMEKLIYNPKLNIKLPSSEEEINDRKYQTNMVNNLIKDKIRIKSFWREVIKEPEECFLLMIIDDSGNNYGFKRKDLLDPRITSIGINSIKIGRYFACYIQIK